VARTLCSAIAGLLVIVCAVAGFTPVQAQDVLLETDTPAAARVRLGGAGRIDTAVAVSRAAYPGAASTVYLAHAGGFPDALAAGALTDGPVLLVPDRLPVPDVVLEEIRRLTPSSVVALGGQGAIPGSVLAAAAEGRAIARLGGTDRFETAIAIARAAFPETAERVYLARGDHFPDALAAAALTDGPVLLVPAEVALAPDVVDEVERLDPAEVVALGGPAAVPDEVLDEVAGGRISGRLAGADRFATAIAVAAAAFPDGSPRVYLARADAFPDALAAGSVSDGPVLLVPGCGRLPEGVRAALAQRDTDEVVVLGGDVAVCDWVLRQAAHPIDRSRLPLPTFAHAAGAPLTLVSGWVSVASYHEAGRSIPTTPMHPALPVITAEPPADSSAWGVVEATRRRGTHPHSAVDLAMPYGEVVYAPVTGHVAAVEPYLLYGRIPDLRMKLVPDAAPGVEVVVLHVDGAMVQAGDRLVAGQTPLAVTPRVLPFASTVEKVSGPLPHVHIEVRPR
jgi:hypothetical protein